MNAIGSKARRSWATLLAAIALLGMLGILAVGIVLTQQQAKEHVRSSFSLRGETSAQSVATYLSEQASRERAAARRFLASPRISRARFGIVAASLGSTAAVLLDESGAVVAAAPSRPRLRGANLAERYSHLVVAQRRGVGISGTIISPVTGTAVTAIAVSFRTAHGVRVLSADYPASGLALDALVDHTIAYPQHEVFLLDSGGQVIAASPRVSGGTLRAADPFLATAARHASTGSVRGASTPTTFTVAHVPDTSWRLLIAVPNSRLFASLSGWTRYIPWLIFALVATLGALIVVLFAHLLADRARLSALSARMERTAQTDSLTGLYNRRALSEQMTRAAAHARRYEEPISVLMIDLDRFKQTNDRFGHEAGDQVLCTIADCMRDVLRAGDIFGRWGGDEFMAVLPKTDAAGAQATAERLREAARGIALAEIDLPDGVSLSVGVATSVHSNPYDLVREADLALYVAKAEGQTPSSSAPRTALSG